MRAIDAMPTDDTQAVYTAGHDHEQASICVSLRPWKQSLVCLISDLTKPDDQARENIIASERGS